MTPAHHHSPTHNDPPATTTGATETSTAPAAVFGATGRRRRIVITGATGTVGRLVAGKLAAGGQCVLACLTRDPRAARRSHLPGHLIGADYENTTRLTEAFHAADAVLIITNNPLRPDHDHNVLNAAQAAGVGHLVKLSALAVQDTEADDLITRWQRTNEQRISASGIPHTLLRPRAFMSHALAWRHDIHYEHTVKALYPDSLNACIDPDDIAQVAANALLADRRNCTYDLTGPQAISARDQTRHLSHLTGTRLRCIELTPHEAQTRWRQRWPEPIVQALLHSAERQKNGAKAYTTNGVHAATGHAPGSFRQWAGRHHTAFRTANPPNPDPHTPTNGENTT